VVCATHLLRLRLDGRLIRQIGTRHRAIALHMPECLVPVPRSDARPHAKVRAGIVRLLDIHLIADPLLAAFTSRLGEGRSELAVERFVPTMRPLTSPGRAVGPRRGRRKMYIHSSLSLSILSV